MFRAVIRYICVQCRERLTGLHRQEQGQALPIALAVLALGSLVTAPFLSHAGTALRSSQQYQQSMSELYTCESAIEQAVWALTHDDLSVELTEPGSSLSYSLEESLNGLTAQITLDWLDTAGDNTTVVPGDIQDTVLDTFQFAETGILPDLIRVSGNVYAVVFTDGLNRGRMVTFEISLDGEISDDCLDSFTFSGTDCYSPDIVKVAEGVFAVAYRGSNNDGYIRTLSVNALGEIDQSEIDTLEFDSYDCYEPCIINTSGDIYAVAYRGQHDDGMLKTVSISVNGQIGETTLDSLEFDTKSCHEPDLFGISGEIFGLAYRGQSNDGTLCTFSVSPGGQIGDSLIETLEFDQTKGYQPCVARIDTTIFAVAYRDVSKNGYLRTFEINLSGDISEEMIDGFSFDSVNASQPVPIRVTDGVYGIVYQGRDNDGYVGTFNLDNNGDLGEELTDQLEFDTLEASDPGIIHISGNIFAVFYSGAGDAGYVRTIYIETSLPEGGEGEGSGSDSYLITASAGNNVISALVEKEESGVEILEWRINP